MYFFGLKYSSHLKHCKLSAFIFLSWKLKIHKQGKQSIFLYFSNLLFVVKKGFENYSWLDDGLFSSRTFNFHVILFNLFITYILECLTLCEMHRHPFINIILFSFPLNYIHLFLLLIILCSPHTRQCRIWIVWYQRCSKKMSHFD